MKAICAVTLHSGKNKTPMFHSRVLAKLLGVSLYRCEWDAKNNELVIVDPVSTAVVQLEKEVEKARLELEEKIIIHTRKFNKVVQKLKAVEAQ